MNQQKKNRDFIADWRNWENIEALDQLAQLHKKETYFEVKGKYDTFDNIRAALYQYRNNKCCVLTGVLWRLSWLDAKNGIIPYTYENDGFGHAFLFLGQKVIEGELYLVAQLSQGTGYGDNGIFYFPRPVVNKEIGKYGIFMFNDIQRGEAESYMDSRKPLHKNFWNYIIGLIKQVCLIS